jgi:hypothetical protein
MVTLVITVKVVGEQNAEAQLRLEAVAFEAMKRLPRMPGVQSIETRQVDFHG